MQTVSSELSQPGRHETLPVIQQMNLTNPTWHGRYHDRQGGPFRPGWDFGLEALATASWYNCLAALCGVLKKKKSVPVSVNDHIFRH